MFALLAAINLTVLWASLSFAQDDMIKLIKAESYYVSTYQTGGYYERNMLIQIKNIDGTKQVYVHHSTTDGTWVDIPAKFFNFADSTYELWQVNTKDFFNAGADGTEFVLKYVVNGKTYWDNNNNANYRLEWPLDQVGGGPMLGNGVNVLLNTVGFTCPNLSGYVDVTNLGYHKNITIVYTTDHWDTKKTVDATFVPWQQTGWRSGLTFPNQYGVERWRFETQTCGTEIEFAISYTVNGTKYWDNNYGNNYILKHD